MSEAPWVCCQLGAREHYAAARAMNRRGQLHTLITDAWARPGTPWRVWPGETGRRLRERRSAELTQACVMDFTGSLVAHELRWRMQSLGGWPLVMARNTWFQERAGAALADLAASTDRAPVVFAHSYSARAIFLAAKARGFRTVLGQIDPGPEHHRLVAELAARHPEYGAAPAEPPPAYFTQWREECDLADTIVVNSDWSRALVERAGVPASRLRVVPLPYEAEGGNREFRRAYPRVFSSSRPLRALFVGSATVAKGLPQLLDSMTALADVPVRLDLAGEMAAAVPDRYRRHPFINWHGPVSRSEVMAQYRAADVLVFPSLSDGFGMAQVEAQGWRLPIIASRSCGRVVTHDVNGWLLDEVTADSIGAVLRELASEPSRLARWSSHASTSTSLAEFGRALAAAAA